VAIRLESLSIADSTPGSLSSDGDRLECIIALGHRRPGTCDTLDIWLPHSQDGRVTFYRDGGIPFPHEMLS